MVGNKITTNQGSQSINEDQPLPKWKKFLVSLIVVLVIGTPIALILYFTVFTAPAPGNGGGGFSFTG